MSVKEYLIDYYYLVFVPVRINTGKVILEWLVVQLIYFFSSIGNIVSCAIVLGPVLVLRIYAFDWVYFRCLDTSSFQTRRQSSAVFESSCLHTSTSSTTCTRTRTVRARVQARYVPVPRTRTQHNVWILLVVQNSSTVLIWLDREFVRQIEKKNCWRLFWEWQWMNLWRSLAGPSGSK